MRALLAGIGSFGLWKVHAALPGLLNSLYFWMGNSADYHALKSMGEGLILFALARMWIAAIPTMPMGAMRAMRSMGGKRGVQAAVQD